MELDTYVWLSKMYPKSSMLEIDDHCFTFIDHDGRLDAFCDFKQKCLQALIFNLVINLELVLVS